MPATSATSSKVFFIFFLLRPFTVLTRQTRQAVRAIKQPISLDVYELTKFWQAGQVNVPSLTINIFAAATNRFTNQGTLTEVEGSVRLTSS